MSLFKNKKTPTGGNAQPETNNRESMADLALNSIADGVLLVGADNKIQFANPAAAMMAGYSSPRDLVGLGYQFVMNLEDADGKAVPPELSKLTAAMRSNSAMSTREYALVAAQSEKRVNISLEVTPTGGPEAARIITFRNITKELEEEGDQSEFISTASHEMRTPVASIEGYLGLALNPQTATIDDRARNYLEAAHAASQHLGHLFKDLLDVTKLDDGRQKLHLVPVDIVSKVREFADERMRDSDAQAKKLKYTFGSAQPALDARTIEPLVYAVVDLDSLREVLDNLLENAVKYTPEGGEVRVDVRGDGDKVIVCVADSGIGIAADDIGHIFQKFYRADNSQTRSIGGTGLGLYLVKQRVESMDGRVWAESSFGHGSSFFFSLPRLSSREYEKRRIAYENEQAAEAMAAQQQMAQNQNTVAWPGNNALGQPLNNASLTPANQMTGAHVETLANTLTSATPTQTNAAPAPNPAPQPTTAQPAQPQPAPQQIAQAQPPAQGQPTSPVAPPNPSATPTNPPTPAPTTFAPANSPAPTANPTYVNNPSLSVTNNNPNEESV